MKKFKAAMVNSSLYRRAYIICAFMCNITLVQLIAYAALAILFLWGVFLLVYREVKHRTILKTRYSFWLVLFLAAGFITALIHFNPNILYDLHNLIMLLHAAICFFIFYGIHTEKDLNFRRELYSIASFIVCCTTVLGIFGLACLVAGIQFEIWGIKFIVFENRFCGMYCNPNQLGFSAVVAIFCSHMLLKKDFITISGRERVSNIWLGSCIALNAISLLLCDSNGAALLMVGYAIFFLIYKMFGSERKLSFKQILTKSVSSLLAGVVIVMSLFFVRGVVQKGFVQLMMSTESIVVIEGDLSIQEEGIITLTHENKNIDSGRLKLWQQAGEMFLKDPVIGVGKGNIYDYGKTMFPKGIKFSANFGMFAPIMTDFHNGYITILVCSGAIGFLLFLIFGLKLFKHLCVHVFRDDSLKESSLPCMFAFLCSYLVYAFIEEALMFNVWFMVVFFWLILGYASCFLEQYEPDDPYNPRMIKGHPFRRTII